ncbi:GNAT family N-acetyltransferase [candidate division KSB1 bacterium]|nr:GNAT family N-acetyltransferase [candidate division KSB1 bacterium]NIR69268.1 GNAT family N-acetyltransferase [candidate division KSB1 bacterium]NIS24129.1 GNAT family N-acetyltransferase [candidate division KSB1 bacterium]NIT71043.1 GNAT family N-acetyltransferase [candidate division KSB1 bacterium]NIU24748.1 GNAT family N-acetyltransferase [candidate division KSB1 bacterium]
MNRSLAEQTVLKQDTSRGDDWRAFKDTYPEKFVSEEQIFKHIRRGARIFISSACGEPQYLVRALINYVESHPKAFFDAEMLHVGTLGVAPYIDEKFKHNFRHTSFFVGQHTRDAVNTGMADYTPIFLSQIPKLIQRGNMPLDVALIQTSPPDRHGFLNLGISVDITKIAAQNARLVIAQINSNMPRVHGDGVLHMNDVDFVIPHDEALLEYLPDADSQIAQQIGKFAARLVQNGDTIQIGYGSIPNAILANFADKKHLGVHSELLTDGMAELMQKGVIDNMHKTLCRGKSVSAFCMGTKDTYNFIHNNPAIEFKGIDYTNNPLIIAQNENMTAINMALEVDLTGQATAESIGKTFYSGIGGQADFMRGAVLAKHGKSILTLPSTAKNDEVSRIVPHLKQGAGVTLNRGDVHYVVTEYGIAYLHGKNVRERAMALIAIAHPKFRARLIEEAKKHNLIYKDQAFIPGKAGEYPEHLEAYRTTKTGLEIHFRPVKISDEPLLKEFFYALSDKSLYHRFFTTRQDMGHERLQEFVVIDYTKSMEILAVIQHEEKEEVVGMAQYFIDEKTHMADVAFAVRDDHQDRGIGQELLAYITYVAKKQGLLGFTADVLMDNKPMLHLFKKMGYRQELHSSEGIIEMKMLFN